MLGKYVGVTQSHGVSRIRRFSSPLMLISQTFQGSSAPFFPTKTTRLPSKETTGEHAEANSGVRTLSVFPPFEKSRETTRLPGIFRRGGRNGAPAAIADCGLRIADSRPPALVVDRGVPIAIGDCGLRIADCGFAATGISRGSGSADCNCGLRIADCGFASFDIGCGLREADCGARSVVSPVRSPKSVPAGICVKIRRGSECFSFFSPAHREDVKTITKARRERHERCFELVLWIADCGLRAALRAIRRPDCQIRNPKSEIRNGSIATLFRNDAYTFTGLGRRTVLSLLLRRTAVAAARFLIPAQG